MKVIELDQDCKDMLKAIIDQNRQIVMLLCNPLMEYDPKEDE